MTPHEVIQEIKHFSIDEKNFLIEQISQSLRDEPRNENKKPQFESEKRDLTTEERLAIVENLRGSLRAEGKFVPMTREEEREIYLEHLLEKYG